MRGTSLVACWLKNDRPWWRSLRLRRIDQLRHDGVSGGVWWPCAAGQSAWCLGAPPSDEAMQAPTD